MQIFEKNLRARRKKVVDLEPQRRGPRPKKKPKPPPSENKSKSAQTKEVRVELHKKSRQVRDLILDNKNNKQIAEIVGVDTNFVARMRLRMFRQKMQLIEKGELEVNEDELEFKYLSHEMKGETFFKKFQIFQIFQIYSIFFFFFHTQQSALQSSSKKVTVPLKLEKSLKLKSAQ